MVAIISGAGAFTGDHARADGVNEGAFFDRAGIGDDKIVWFLHGMGPRFLT
jgi:hypothetical protein